MKAIGVDHLVYQSHLDGVRALAIIMVLGFHAGVPGFSGGFIGVDIFFVLSGFLITQSLRRYQNVFWFLRGRVERLAPALLFMLLVYTAVFYVLEPGYPYLRDSVFAFFYLSDYAAAYLGFPKYVVHTWSLSVEFHFYLLWSIIFLFLRPNFFWLVLVYILATAWRWHQSDWVSTYYAFDTRLSGLILGVIIASYHIRPPFTSWLPIILLGGFCFYFYSGALFFQDWGVMLVEFMAVLVIIANPPSWLSNQVFTYLGRISYGIYLWHYPAIRVMKEFGVEWPTLLLVGAVVGVVGGAFSYHFVEPVFRRQKGMNKLFGIGAKS